MLLCICDHFYYFYPGYSVLTISYRNLAINCETCIKCHTLLLKLSDVSDVLTGIGLQKHDIGVDACHTNIPSSS